MLGWEDHEQGGQDPHMALPLWFSVVGTVELEEAIDKVMMSRYNNIWKG